jgi:uncharacterized protein (TIGR00290 family)
MKLISSWSGGKDSCFALMQTLKDKTNTLAVLLNMMNENGKVSRSHGLPLAILQQQADAIGVPLSGTPASWKDYEALYINTLKKLKTAHNTEAVVFGDIDLEPHREWEEKVCAASEHEALLPLWQQDRKELVYAMIDNGIKAIIVSCNTHLGEAFLGREITRDLVTELEAAGVDACGENGEYHTAVIDCPLFSQPVKVTPHKKQTHKDYCFLTW